MRQGATGQVLQHTLGTNSEGRWQASATLPSFEEMVPEKVGMEVGAGQEVTQDASSLTQMTVQVL